MKGARFEVCGDTVEGSGVMGSGDVVRGTGSIGLEKTVGDIGDEGAEDEGNRGMGMGVLQRGGASAMSSGNGEAR